MLQINQTANATLHGNVPDRQPIPLRMVNEYAYCPRLFHFMHVDGRWAENAYTIEGKNVHRRVDQLDHVLANVETDDLEKQATAAKNKPKIDNDQPPDIARSVPLESQTLGITAKLDLVATAMDQKNNTHDAVPVETKRGEVPNNSQRSWEPERIQLMAQGLLLREHGYNVDHGILYFAASKTRVDIPFTSELENRTLEIIQQAQKAAQAVNIPKPLENSPKCYGCSLASICMPDETLTLKNQITQPHALTEIDTLTQNDQPPIRRMFPSRQTASPLYVQEQGARVGKAGQTINVKKKDQILTTVQLRNISHLVLCGNISVSQQAIHLFCESNIPIIHLSSGHWFYGITHGQTLKNAFDRAAQFATAANPEKSLQIAKAIVLAKIQNQRTILRRNTTATNTQKAVRNLADLVPRIEKIHAAPQLLGLEGNAAAIYFAHFSHMIKSQNLPNQWEFQNRNRRPPRDPINALLSFTYALLAKECAVALLAEGLDPWWGFYHKPRHGRPALALDLMEEFRATIADSAVITAINTGMLDQSDFQLSKAGCIMKPTARKAILRAFEARMDQLITHPIFDYRCSWRSIIILQARLLSRYLRRDIPKYIGMIVR